jgi:hypothetical protein
VARLAPAPGVVKRPEGTMPEARATPPQRPSVPRPGASIGGTCAAAIRDGDGPGAWRLAVWGRPATVRCCSSRGWHAIPILPPLQPNRFVHRGARHPDTFSVAIRGPHMTKKYYGPHRRRKTHGARVNSGRIPPPSYILGNKPPKFVPLLRDPRRGTAPRRAKEPQRRQRAKR